MLYLVALSTGLRASELASLKPEGLRLLEIPPTLTVRAGYSKRQRRDVLPILSGLLDEQRGWLSPRDRQANRSGPALGPNAATPARGSKST